MMKNSNRPISRQSSFKKDLLLVLLLNIIATVLHFLVGTLNGDQLVAAKACLAPADIYYYDMREVPVNILPLVYNLITLGALMFLVAWLTYADSVLRSISPEMVTFS